MKTLLLKDVLGQKPNLILGALYSLIFFVGFGLVGDSPASSFVYVFSSVAVGYTLLLGSFKLDVNDTPRFLFSLPISRQTAVNEKFVFLCLGTLYGLFWAILFGLILSLPSIGWATGIINPLDMLRIFAGMGILSFFIPLYFRVGHMIIRYVLIIGIGLLVVGQIVAMLVISFRDRGSGSIAFLDFIFGWMTGKSGSLSRTGIMAMIGAGIGTVSYLASRLIWERRDI